MQNRPSRDPRDIAIRAALADAAALAEKVDDRFASTYRGEERQLYVARLGDFVVDLGGRLEDGPTGLVAAFPGRRITIAFG